MQELAGSTGEDASADDGEGRLGGIRLYGYEGIAGGGEGRGEGEVQAEESGEWDGGKSRFAAD